MRQELHLKSTSLSRNQVTWLLKVIHKPHEQFHGKLLWQSSLVENSSLWNCSQQWLWIILNYWVMISVRKHCLQVCPMYFFTLWAPQTQFQLHCIGVIVDISTADVSEHCHITQRQSWWTDITLGKKKNLFHFIFFVNFSLKWWVDE